MAKDKIINLVVLIVYMIAMLAVGFIFYRKKISNDDFVLGGRKLNPWVTALSAEASDMSGWMLMGLPGLAYAGMLTNIGRTKEAIWTALGVLIGTIVNWILVAKRLRVYTQVSGDAKTISSYLKNRFKENSGLLKIVSALALCIFFTVYAASMFSASAVLFKNLFGIDYKIALVIGVTVITSYVMLGGFLAASWTDLFQGLLMFFAIVTVPIIALAEMDPIQKVQTRESLIKAFSIIPRHGDEFSWMTVLTGLAWGLGYFGMPHVLVRFMAIKDPRKTKSSIFIASVWVTISVLATIIMGITAFGHIKSSDNPERIFIDLSSKLLHPVFAGVIISATIAAVMSTADSQLLVASSAVVNDIYYEIKQKNGKDVSDKKMIRLGRLLIILLAIVAFLIALNEHSSIFELVKYAWGGLGASFGPVILFSLYSKKLNKYGAVASIITGVVTTVVFKYGLSRLGGIWQIYELIPGFLLSTLMLYVISYATNRKIKPEIKKAIEDEFDVVKYSLSKIRKDKYTAFGDIVEKSSAYVEKKRSDENRVIAFKEFGTCSKKHILLCHPGFADLTEQSCLIKSLRDDYHIIVPLFRGFGDNSSDYISHENSVDEIKGYLESKGYTHIAHAYGYGMFNDIIINLFATDIKIKKTVLISSEVHTTAFGKRYFKDNKLDCEMSYETKYNLYKSSKDIIYTKNTEDVKCQLLGSITKSERLAKKYIGVSQYTIEQLLMGKDETTKKVTFFIDNNF